MRLSKTSVKWVALAGAALLFLASLMLLACSNKIVASQPPGLHGPSVQRFVVLLSTNLMENKSWQFKASQEGIVEAVEPDFNSDDELAPGCTSFVFVGSAPGEVRLDFYRTDLDNPLAQPLDFAFYKLRVLPDKSIELLEFYKEYGDTNGPGNEYSLIVLPGGGPLDTLWSYAPVANVEQRDLAALPADEFERRLARPDGVEPFLFYGVKPGDAVLNFKRTVKAGADSQPVEQTLKFKIRVFENNSTYIIGSSLSYY